MSARKRISASARSIASGAKKKRTGGRGAVGITTETSFGADLTKLNDELLGKVCPTAVGKAATIVKMAAREDIRKGGTSTTLGMSKKTKTRGVMGPQGYMISVGRGSWSSGPSQVAQRRGGPNAPTIAGPGGIIKKPISRKGGGKYASQLVGPKYKSGPGGFNYGHTHEPEEGKESGAPNHKWWGNDASRPLAPRPFLRPAAERTLVEQMGALKEALRKWEIDPSEVFDND